MWKDLKTAGADNPDDPQLSTEDLVFLLSNTHYRYLPVFTFPNLVWIIHLAFSPASRSLRLGTRVSSETARGLSCPEKRYFH